MGRSEGLEEFLRLAKWCLLIPPPFISFSFIEKTLSAKISPTNPCSRDGKRKGRTGRKEKNTEGAHNSLSASYELVRTFKKVRRITG